MREGRQRAACLSLASVADRRGTPFPSLPSPLALATRVYVQGRNIVRLVGYPGQPDVGGIVSFSAREGLASGWNGTAHISVYATRTWERLSSPCGPLQLEPSFSYFLRLWALGHTLNAAASPRWTLHTGRKMSDGGEGHTRTGPWTARAVAPRQ
jgi:hypothetical protein